MGAPYHGDPPCPPSAFVGPHDFDACILCLLVGKPRPGVTRLKPRHLAQHRLARTVPGEDAADLREIPERLLGREDRGPVSAESIVERAVTVWDRRPVPISRFRMPELGRPTPLLKRLVRHPISMEPAGSKRVDVYDATRPAPIQVVRDRIEMTFKLPRDARDRPPLEVLGPESRALPFARRRDAGSPE